MNELNVSISLDLCELQDLRSCVESKLEFQRKLDFSEAILNNTTALLDKINAAIDQWWKNLE
jgi:hypothetical protein